MDLIRLQPRHVVVYLAYIWSCTRSLNLVPIMQDKYKVYNLCSERLYDASRFEGKVYPNSTHLDLRPYILQAISIVALVFKATVLDLLQRLLHHLFPFLQVASFPFDDHNCPPMQLIPSFCQSAYTWLKQDIQNVVVVHCKAGMARTGLMICCLLLYLKVRLK